VFPKDIKQSHARRKRIVDKSLKQNRRNLLKALEEFANFRRDEDGWRHFRKRWPGFFPSDEYDKVFDGSKPSVTTHPHWLDVVWEDSDPSSVLNILLGIESPPSLEGVEQSLWTHEDAYLRDITPIPALCWFDWNDATFVYMGACDFQRALFLLCRESWRARLCSKCSAKFIAKRAAQKYCSNVCSLAAQREYRKKWWDEHGERWRKDRKASLNSGGGMARGSNKAR
jgi:hypothetical protein